MIKALTSEHVRAYADARQLRDAKAALWPNGPKKLVLPAKIYALIREAEELERRKMFHPPMPDGELIMRGIGWAGWTVKRGG